MRLDPALAPLIELLYATAAGVIVGLEREHAVTTGSEGEPTGGPSAPPGVIGVRSFTLLAVLGWMTAYLATWAPWLPPAAVLVVGGLLAARRVHATEAGLATEVAAVVVFGLGLLVRHDHRLTIAIALFTTLVLATKPWTRAVVPKLRRVEITGTVQLLVLLAVVLPMLPEDAVDPWGALPPRKVGLFVVLVASISYVGYVLTRVMGARRSAGLTGVVGGLASSTAVTAAMAQDARRDPGMRLPGQMATFLANAVMCVRVIVIVGIVAPSVAFSLAPPMGTMAGALLAGAAWKAHRVRRHPPPEPALATMPQVGNPFAIVPALKWGAILCVVLVVAEGAQRYLGERGVFAAAAASGIADVDAITLAVARQAAQGTLSHAAAAVAVAVAVTANAVVKSGIAFVAGGVAFGRDVALVLLLATAAGVVVALAG